MFTDDEKFKLSKLLDAIEVPEVRITERCHDLVSEIRKKYGSEVEEELKAEINDVQGIIEFVENPYKVDKGLLDENERKLKEISGKRKLSLKPVITNDEDPKRPWRTHSCKEKLLRIDNEIKRHDEKASEPIKPLHEGHLTELLAECKEERIHFPSINPSRVNQAVEETKTMLSNFQYKHVENSTALSIAESV